MRRRFADDMVEYCRKCGACPLLRWTSLPASLPIRSRQVVSVASLAISISSQIRVGHHDGAANLHQPLRGIPEVPDMRPEDTRHAIAFVRSCFVPPPWPSRLPPVKPMSARPQATPSSPMVSRRTIGGISGRGSATRDRRSTILRFLDKPLDFLEAVGMTRDQDDAAVAGSARIEASERQRGRSSFGERACYRRARSGGRK